MAEALALLATPWLIGATDIPARAQPPLVLLVWLVGGLSLWWYQTRPLRRLWLQVAPRPLVLDGIELEQPALHDRGPWLQLRWQGPGRAGHLLFWPDVLSRGQRRELRLAIRARQVSRQPPSVAP